ncbi:DUF423 domain-containing protein [Salinisphaera aquimarina]|uniref:DUF423 domain-containing protein n=1 Tax=Salinisphaera aquimarina TaxID=2094031 RepID=A0ABV7EL17_9GAMM
MTQFALVAASIYGLLGVVLGAFGAHALSARLSPEMQSIWHTAVQYQFFHVAALLAVGVLARQGMTSGALSVAGVCFTLGTLVFSGSLYLLALSGVRWLGAITPLGGVLLILGWLALLWAVTRG